ncbi:DUF5684 domain-containing protein [Halosimplex salinum]|uniref:DUF5684 domain-containing protein n=1 Tax=Halosimplex salinum TaxID=1710538 RepID=UPI001F1D0CC3|nr:DUF5684 domain-containing protein [Halosimplex salinum]
MAGNMIPGIGTVALQGDGAGAIAALGLMFFVIPMVLALLAVAGMWKTFTKAGQPGWAAIIPIYNIYVLVAEIAGRDMVWVLLSIFVPFAVIVPMIDVAKAFGKGAGYGIGLFFLGFVFFPLLGFGDARYRGSSSAI